MTTEKLHEELTKELTFWMQVIQIPHFSFWIAT